MSNSGRPRRYACAPCRWNYVFRCGVLTTLLLAFTAAAHAAEWGLKAGTASLKSAGPLVFGPDGILFAGDPGAATIYALATGDVAEKTPQADLNIAGVNAQLAELLKTPVAEIAIQDLAVNPETGHAYLSVSSGRGASATAAIVRVANGDRLSLLSLSNIPYSKIVLPDAPEDKVVNRNGRSQNLRQDAITDLAYMEGKVYVSGLASSSAPSSVHVIPFPFADAAVGTSVEIYHAAHGRSEDAAPIRTFVPLMINGQPNLLAGFVCTPLVRLPVNALKAGEKTRGTTVAELGNRNRPLDMIVYEQAGRKYLLLSNSARGVMKVSLENVAREEGLTTPVPNGGTAGQSFEPVPELAGVVELDRLNDQFAIVIQAKGDQLDLQTVRLP